MVELFYYSLSDPARFAHFVQYLITFCRRPEAASDVIFRRFVGPIVLDKCVKFRGLSLNRSQEMPHDGCRRMRYFRQLFRYNFRHEVDNDAISSTAVGNVGMDVHI